MSDTLHTNGEPIIDNQPKSDVSRNTFIGLVGGLTQGLLVPGKNELAKLRLPVSQTRLSEFGIRANLAERSGHAFVGGAAGAIIFGIGSYLIEKSRGPDKAR